jgi:fimbrial chaperone protein
VREFINRKLYNRPHFHWLDVYILWEGYFAMLKEIVGKVLFCVSVSCCSFFCEAIEVVPAVHQFDPSETNGDGNVIQYSVKNLKSEPIAMEVTVFQRKIKNTGEDDLLKDEGSFDIYPQQIIIPPNGTRTVKVRWLGNETFNKNPHLEQAFRVRFEQFSIAGQKRKKDQKGPVVELRFVLLTSLYMMPSQSSPNVKLVSVSQKANANDVYVVRLKNDGTRRLQAQKVDLKLRLFGEDKPFGDFVSENEMGCPIMPGSERDFTITRKKSKVVEKSKANDVPTQLEVKKDKTKE